MDTIQDIHAEITNRCNAACPMCSRNVMGGADVEGLIHSEWSQDDIRRVFIPELTGLRSVNFCGTHGDPAAARYTLDAVERIKSISRATVEVRSNGSVRDKSWWHDLGKMLNAKKENDGYYRQHDLAVFSIDGLEDTNALYRRRTNFNKIMENAEAFIGAGGLAKWDFIVFKHNEHQIYDAEALAKKMGFFQFRVKRTFRFANSPFGRDRAAVLNKDRQLEYFLEPPTQERWRNPEIDKYLRLDAAGLQDYFNTTPINCMNKSVYQGIYVNAFVQVLPCCFLSSDLYPSKNEFHEDTKSKFSEKYGENFTSLRTKTWQEILAHPFYTQDLTNSWNTDVAGGRFKRCARTCGAQFSPILTQSGRPLDAPNSCGKDLDVRPIELNG